MGSAKFFNTAPSQAAAFAASEPPP